jgi:hypothetical protein
VIKASRSRTVDRGGDLNHRIPRGLQKEQGSVTGNEGIHRTSQRGTRGHCFATQLSSSTTHDTRRANQEAPLGTALVANGRCGRIWNFIRVSKQLGTRHHRPIAQDDKKDSGISSQRPTGITPIGRCFIVQKRPLIHYSKRA